MNLVEQVARMLDDEGAFSVAYADVSGKVAIALTTRQKYFQAKYEARAVELLKFISSMTKTAIKADLIEFEMQGWKRLGVPLERLPDARAIIEDKY